MVVVIPLLTKTCNLFLRLVGLEVEAHVNWIRDELVYFAFQWKSGRIIKAWGKPIKERYLLRPGETVSEALERLKP